MINLPNNCYCSELSVHPKNWKSIGASTKKDWYIHYRFYDPQQKDRYPKGKLVIVKGMNSFKTADGRRKQTRVIMDIEKDILINDGHNPITGIESPEIPGDHIPQTAPFIKALLAAREHLECGHKTKRDIKSMLKYFIDAAGQIGIHNKPVGQIKFNDINLVLKKVARNRAPFSPARFNKYRTYLMMLFTELLESGSVDHNPVRDIKKKKEMVVIRETLSKQERRHVDLHLRKKKMMRFRLYNRLFFHSGIRNTEMLSLQGHHINLTDQLIRCTIRKGGQVTEVNKTIKNIAVRYWKLALSNCGPNDFIFSRKLAPGPVKIDESQINRRWKRHVKDELGITSDFYALKHGNTTEMVDYAGDEVAADLNSHKGTAMVRKIYDIKRASRNHEEIKAAANQF